MAEVQLSPEQLRHLINLIATRAGVLDITSRQNLLELAGLSDFVPRLNLAANAQAFSQDLIRTLQNQGLLASTGQPALVSLLRELRDMVQGHPDEVAFIDSLLIPLASQMKGSAPSSPRLKVFVSYRRKSWAFTHRMAGDLKSHLNADIFVDMNSIDQADFENSILTHLREADAVLVVVSPETFSDRIKQPSDWVHREIREALTLHKPIVLVAVEGLYPPSANKLPTDIQGITGKQAVPFYPEFWDAAIDKLAKFIPVVIQNTDQVIPTAPAMSPPDPSATTSAPAKVSRTLNSAFVVAIITGLFVLGAAFLASWLPPYFQAQQQNGTTTAQALIVPGSTTPTGISVALIASPTVSITPSTTRIPASATRPTATLPPTLTSIPPTATNVLPTATLPPTLTPIPPTATTVPPTITPTPTATPPPAETVRTDAAGIAQVFVPKGCFLMGSDPAKDSLAGRDEQPQHKVCLTHDYWIDQYDVTNAAFDAFVKAGGYSTDAFWSSDGLAWKQSNNISGPDTTCTRVSSDPQQPRVCVNWYEAEAYAKWRTQTATVGTRYRLPTEAEWEYAARGPQSLIYPWGDGSDNSKANVVSSIGKTSLVNQYPSGKSWVGAYDMAGNVFQWTADWYDRKYYSDNPQNDPPGPSSGQYRALRGGSSVSNQDLMRSASRVRDVPAVRYDSNGFRLVLVSRPF